MLLPIAFCIYLVIESNDMNVRAGAAAAAIVVETVRDALTARELWAAGMQVKMKK